MKKHEFVDRETKRLAELISNDPLKWIEGRFVCTHNFTQIKEIRTQKEDEIEDLKRKLNQRFKLTLEVKDETFTVLIGTMRTEIYPNDDFHIEEEVDGYTYTCLYGYGNLGVYLFFKGGQLELGKCIVYCLH